MMAMTSNYLIIKYNNLPTRVPSMMQENPSDSSSTHLEQQPRALPKQINPNLAEYQSYADSSLETQFDLAQNIEINIPAHQTRLAFVNYVVYHIVGRDKNGPFDVYRRFNQFYKMRMALTKRFPGCFVPSIPEKSISIVDGEIANKRHRYLNDFVRRMAKLPHLYNSEEFQALLRSAQKDLSGTFEKWPEPTPTDIINKYKHIFSHLSGKVIDSSVKESIASFIKIIERTSVYMYRFKIDIKELAMVRSRFDKSLSPFITKSLPNFEKEVISQCWIEAGQLIFLKNGESLEQTNRKIEQTLAKNPYWLIYDLVKRQQRDGCAFLQCTKAISQYQRKSHQLQIKMSQNSRSISQATYGKRSNSELKYKLQVQNQALKKENEALQCLTDIITAIVAFVEMQRFKEEKRAFYLTVLRKLGGYQFSQLRVLHELWGQLEERSKAILAKIQSQ